VPTPGHRVAASLRLQRWLASETVVAGRRSPDTCDLGKNGKCLTDSSSAPHLHVIPFWLARVNYLWRRAHHDVGQVAHPGYRARRHRSTSTAVHHRLPRRPKCSSTIVRQCSPASIVSAF
jgi:hypothetical protein